MNLHRLAIATLFAALVALTAPSLAAAHPMGNFTVNRYARIQPAGDGVRIVYVLDLAEIPTFQERPRIDADGDGALSPSELDAYAASRADQIRAGLQLTLDDRPSVLRTNASRAALLPGQGGLETLRLEATYAVDHSLAGQSSVRLTFRDDNEPARIGWREIIARPGSSSTALADASVPGVDLSDELRRYPEDLLASPLNVRQARLSFTPGAAASTPDQIRQLDPAFAGASVERAKEAITSLITADELSPTAIVLSLLLAVALGALHALEPGHGKTVVAAYLVGDRGTARHAFALGATVTATHTAGVYALGFVTLFLSQYILPERLYPALQLVSGLLVVALGLWLFGTRIRAFRKRTPGHSYGGGEEHAHGHGHEGHHDPGLVPHEHAPLPHSHGGRAHTHAPIGDRGGPMSWRGLVAMGVSGGLVPCPGALVVLLGAIALHRVAFGMLLIVAFSLGLAAVLVGIGLLLVSTRHLFGRVKIGGSLLPKLVPVASALVILVFGLSLTARALPPTL